MALSGRDHCINEAIFYLGVGAFRHLHHYPFGRIRKRERKRWAADYGYPIRDHVSRYDGTAARIYVFIHVFHLYHVFCSGLVQ